MAKVYSMIGGGSGGGSGLVPDRLVITGQPEKTDYKVGETFQTEGLKVELYYTNGAHFETTGYTWEPMGPLTEGTEHVTISYSESGKTVTAEVDITVKRETIPVPTQKDTLTYSHGVQQEPQWDNYDPAKMDMTGETKMENAGTYHATFTPKERYQWGEGDHGEKQVEWTIDKAQGAVSAEPSEVNLGPDHTRDTVTISKTGDGALSIENSAQDVINAQLDDATLTVESVDEKSGTATITVKLADGDNYLGAQTEVTVNAAFVQVWGVMWDMDSPNTALTRLTPEDDPNRLVTETVSAEPTPMVNSTGGSSPFDDIMPWKGMEEYNISEDGTLTKSGEGSDFSRDKDTVVFIPEYYYAVKKEGNKICYYVGNGPADGLTKHPGSNVYVGRYDTSGSVNAQKSVTGQMPLVSQNRGAFRTGAKQKTVSTGKWYIYDYMRWCAVWLLYLEEYADWNSQAKVGLGYANSNSAALASGDTDAMTYHTGTADTTLANGKKAVQYRHIENPWGNVRQFLDGYNANGTTAYFCDDPEKYKDDTNTDYTALGVALPSDSWIKSLDVSEAAPWAFCPKTNGGSDATYIPDYVYSSSGWRVLDVGGAWNYGSGAGLFCFRANGTSSGVLTYLSSRLLYIP